MQLLKNHGYRHRLSAGLLLVFLWAADTPLSAQKANQHHDITTANNAPAPFSANTTKSFSNLMNDAMGVMDYGMGTAPMNGDPDHDFSAMMIPHHQGAINMANAELLYGKDPVLRRLAQEIIVTQSSEITVMYVALKKYSAGHSVKP